MKRTSFIMLSLTLSLVLFGPSEHIPTAPKETTGKFEPSQPLPTLPFASSTSEFWEGQSLSDGEGRDDFAPAIESKAAFVINDTPCLPPTTGGQV